MYRSSKKITITILVEVNFLLTPYNCIVINI